MSTDPYKRLGLAPGASAAEIKRAYRALAREHHPDRNPGDPGAAQRFKDVNTAYEALIDPDRPYVPGGAATATEDFHADFTDALERAERLVFQELLPRYRAMRVGPAERIVLLARDYATAGLLTRLTGPRAPFWARWAARGDARRIAVHVDYGRAPQPAQVWRRRGGGWVLMLYPSAFWEGGIREPIPLDDAVLTILTGQVIGILRATVRVDLRGVEGPAWEGLRDAARDQDRDASRRAWAQRALWIVVGLFGAFLLTMGWVNRR